jgi:glycosyltransferase involved in cell wall biosynthesis
VPDVWFAIPGDLATRTGGYAYARNLMAALPEAGWTPHHVCLPGGFPAPSAGDLAATREILSQLPPSAIVLMDGLAYGALPREVIESVELRFVALVHHPLARETGLTKDDARRLWASERAALGVARAVATTSRHTAEHLARDYAVPELKLHVAYPGTKRAQRATPKNAVPRLLTVATLTQRKGHDTLIQALAMLKGLSWHSMLVGSMERDPSVTANIRLLIASLGLEGRVNLCGELDDHELGAVYADADIFVLPSRYEGYGMVFAEALACGLPIVACASGAVVDTVPATAGLMMPPDDPVALADALRRVISDLDLRRQLADSAWSHGRRLPTWNDTAASISQALRSAQS